MTGTPDTPGAQGNGSRPPATPAQMLKEMDHTIATHLLSQQEMAKRLNLNVTDLTCFAYVLEAGENLLTAGDLPGSTWTRSARQTRKGTGRATGKDGHRVRGGEREREGGGSEFPAPADLADRQGRRFRPLTGKGPGSRRPSGRRRHEVIANSST
jgi:hypothetical protein